MNNTTLVQTLLITDVATLWRNVFLGTILIATLVLTVLGNLLVVFAVLREHHMRANLTNRFLVSLAVADLLMGGIVMPFAVVHTLGNGYWSFGRDWCDIWHAFDVLCTTASILNLCAIAVERFWATENPISYASEKTRRRCTIMLISVWICSIAISFPAIAWWRSTSDYFEGGPNECLFTHDTAYLICSSLVSFYIPLIVMTSVYIKIYQTATKLIRSLQIGEKVVPCNVHQKGGSRFPALKRVAHSTGTQGRNILSTMTRLENPVDKVILRIHRGGRPKSNVTFCPTNHTTALGTSQAPGRRKFASTTQAAYLCGSCPGCLVNGGIHEMAMEHPSGRASSSSTIHTSPSPHSNTHLNHNNMTVGGAIATTSHHHHHHHTHHHHHHHQHNNQHAQPHQSKMIANATNTNNTPSPTTPKSRACMTCCLRVPDSRPIHQCANAANPTTEDLPYTEILSRGKITSQPSVARLVMRNTPDSGQSRAKQWVSRLRIFAATTRISKFVREQKAAKTLGLVMGLFIGCWLPFFVCNIIVAFSPSLVIENVTFQHILTVVTWLGYVNSCINPIIYAHSMREFRRAFNRLLCSWWWNYASQKRYRNGRTMTRFGGFKPNHVNTTQIPVRLERPHTMHEFGGKIGQLDCLELATDRDRHISTAGQTPPLPQTAFPGAQHDGGHLTTTHSGDHAYYPPVWSCHSNGSDLPLPLAHRFTRETGGLYSSPPSLVHPSTFSPMSLLRPSSARKHRVLSASHIPHIFTGKKAQVTSTTQRIARVCAEANF